MINNLVATLFKKRNDKDSNESEFAKDPDINQENIDLAETLHQQNTTQSNKYDTNLPITIIEYDAAESIPYHHVPLNIVDGTFVRNSDSAALLREIGGSACVHKITTLFYQKVMLDSHISKFIRNRNDPHAERLGNWIVEKMGGEGNVWTEERATRSKCPVQVLLGDGREHVVHDRTSAHVAAWFSPNRNMNEMGQRFNLKDSRIWMRLMFWSARETGVFSRSPSFEKWYQQFIAHFIRVYEHTAPPYASESLQWSANQANIESYYLSSNKMIDIAE